MTTDHHPPAGPDTQAARGQIARILASRHFAKAERLRRFLQFVSEETFRGLTTGIKETVIGVEVFGRSIARYDTRIDPIVRVQAGRLRARLEAYYMEDGAADPVLVTLPRGQYVPRFALRPSVPARRADTPQGLASWQANTIAVLPFASHGADAGDDYFGDGLTEEVTHALTRIPSLRVTARRSAFRFRNRERDIREIGRLLGAGKVVEGSVRKVDGHLRISVQLVNVADGCEIWSEQYDRAIPEMFAVQNEIARAVQRALKGRQARGRAAELAAPAANADALNHYLWGRFHWNKRSESGLRAGIAHFSDATRIDPSYARAYSGLADCHIMLAMSGAERPLTAMQLARQAALRAVEIDDRLVEAHTSLAVVHANFDWDRNRAEFAFQRALECDATYATLHHWYSLYSLTPEYRFQEAEDEIEWAEQLDPVSLPINLGHAQVFQLADNSAAAIAQCTKVLALDPTYYRAYWFLGLAHDRLGNLAAAIEALETARAKGAGERAFANRILGALGHAYGRAGDKARAAAIRDEMSAATGGGYVDPLELAQVHAGLGDTDAALDALERAAEDRSGYLVFAGLWPAFEELRLHKRFRALLGGMSLTAESSGPA